MEKKINIAELLKGCPKGMELDCTMFDNVVFDEVITVRGFDDKKRTKIILSTHYSDGTKDGINLTEFGTYTDDENAKCVIFPKGETTWEGFIPPCQFKDGDIVVAEDNESFQLFLLKHLTRSADYNDHDGYCYFGWNFQCNELFEKGNWGFNRLATEEEKQYLFDTIKDNGYKWNEETKTLEKLIEPKFKVGDRIRIIGTTSIYVVTEVREHCYILDDKDMMMYFINQYQWELAPNKFDITTLKPFESRVLVKPEINSFWMPSFFGFYKKDTNVPFVCCNGYAYKYCIPYENNEHLLGTTDDCDEFYKTWE